MVAADSLVTTANLSLKTTMGIDDGRGSGKREAAHQISVAHILPLDHADGGISHPGWSLFCRPYGETYGQKQIFQMGAALFGLAFALGVAWVLELVYNALLVASCHT